MDFSRPGNARQVWHQLQPEKKWGHYNKPSGCRFLGSFQLSRQESEQLLDITASNLRRVGSLTFRKLNERFNQYDSEKYWIRVVTLALSEYAYYGDSDSFWPGLCKRLNIEKSQQSEIALRRVLDKGFKQLGLIQTKHSYRYVSTLWLQSGIPQKSLAQFSQLLEKVLLEYDWWEIERASPEDLSCLLYEFCSQHEYRWEKKLLTFLGKSCADDNDSTEPISGQLLNGLATIAKSLNMRGVDPNLLQHSHTREEVLSNFGMPNTFFIRDWDDLIRVLTPQTKKTPNQRAIIGQRKKSLRLRLDVSESKEIELYLPAQTLQKSGWRDLGYVKIPEQGWDSTLSKDGRLEISEELVLPIKHIADLQNWHLRSHTNKPLLEWHCPGVSEDYPILVFDVWGERLVLPNDLKGKTEITCFYPRTTQLELSDNIEVVKSFIPCSISNWRGIGLQLTGKQAQLIIQTAGSAASVCWKRQLSEYTQLRGLKHQSKTPTYLEVPSIWHPPLNNLKLLNIKIESLDRRKVLTNIEEKITLIASHKWQKTDLSQWINQNGAYSVLLWNEHDRWSERFEICSSVEVSQPSLMTSIQVCDRNHEPLNLPVQASSPSSFWLEEMIFKKIWPLESVRFLIASGKEKYTFLKQADTSGQLALSLACYRDELPDSQCYSLSYQQQGTAQSIILSTSVDVAVCTWTSQELQLSNLQESDYYCLSAWNVLEPTKALSRYKLGQNTRTLTIDFKEYFSDVLGIFFMQLENPTLPPQSLGWWSNIPNLENLALPHNSLLEFCDQFKDIDLTGDCKHIERAITSLENHEGYLPEWISYGVLLQKLHAITAIYSASQNRSHILPPTNDSSDFTYALELQEHTPEVHKNCFKILSFLLSQSGLGPRAIQLDENPVAEKLIGIKLEKQQYLIQLIGIVNSLEPIIRTKLELKEWEALCI